MKRLILLGALIPLAGCSQIAQLQPVAGAEVTAVRIATNDVLVEKNVPIAVAPTCGLEGELYVCKGTARNGQEIRSEAKSLEAFGATKTEYGAYSPAVVSLKVTVGAREIFNGQVETVLAENAQEAK
jgi:hypothetical protein